MGVKPPNKSATGSLAAGWLTTNCAKFIASGSAPDPSFPKNNNAWLKRLCCTMSIKCALTDACPIMSLNTNVRAFNNGYNLPVISGLSGLVLLGK